MRVWLLALMPVLLIAQGRPVAADKKCSASGRVTNASTGQPVRKAMLHLQPSYRDQETLGTAGLLTYFAIADENGTFHFVNVAPGFYTLSAEHDGFIKAEYGASKLGGPGALLSLQPDHSIDNIEFALPPAGVIAGRVLDEDGDPVSKGGVTAFAQRRSRGNAFYDRRSEAAVNDRGEFRLAELTPGTYFLCVESRPPETSEIRADGKPNTRAVTTFYPAATAIAEAAPIQVGNGQEVDGIEIRIRTAGMVHVRGRVALSKDANPAGLTVVLLSGESFGESMYGDPSADIKKDGTFEISGVTAGLYKLTLFAVQDNGRRTAGSQTITIGSADVNDVVLNALPAGRLHGNVRVDGPAPTGAAQWNPATLSIQVELYVAGQRYIPEPLTTKPDGGFVSRDLSPAAYIVSAYNGPDGAYLASVLFNNQEMLGRPIDLSHGGAGELEIVYRYGAAKLDGTVRLPDRTPAAGEANAAIPAVTVVLTPEQMNADGSGGDIAEMHSDATFAFKNVPPGRYHVYALEEAGADVLANPAVANAFEDKSAEIELKENERQHVQVQMISSDEQHQVLARLGLEP